MSFTDRLASLVQGASLSAVGQAALYRPKAGGETSVQLIWANGYYEFDEDGTATASRRPTADVRVADVREAFDSGPQEDDVVVVENDALGGEVEYRVNWVEHDGQGMAKLHLHLVDTEAAA